MTENLVPKWTPEDIAKHASGLRLFGIVLIVLGFAAIALPRMATFAVDIFLGFVLILAGGAHVIHALRPNRWQGFILDLALGALFIVTGFLLLRFPIQGEMTLTLLLAAALVAEGIFKFIAAARLRGQPGAGWITFSGLMALILGVLIGIEWPSSSQWVIGLLVGIDLVFGGWTLVMLGAATRNTSETAGNEGASG